MQKLVFKQGYYATGVDSQDRNGFIRMNNRLTPWTVRVRQLRVKAENCKAYFEQDEVTGQARTSEHRCYPKYDHRQYPLDSNRECGCIKPGGQASNLGILDESKDSALNAICSSYNNCGDCSNAEGQSCTWCSSDGSNSTGKCIGGCTEIAKCELTMCDCSLSSAKSPDPFK